MLLVSRTCVRQADTKDDRTAEPMSLDDTHALIAYVLLGDPGMGKTSAFRQQAELVGGHFICAGDLLTFDDLSELKNSARPIFIDGLDETRAGSTAGRVPLDNIRNKLRQLGCHSFRLSCRAADWLGNPDARKLQSLLSSEDEIQVLTLQPLTLTDVEIILRANHGISDAQAFIASAEKNGLTDLLLNPQTLAMLAAAVGPNNRWPETRQAVFEMACDRLVLEHNDEHLAATYKSAPDHDSLKRAAAYLCALQLIADLTGFSPLQSSHERVISLNEVPNAEERLPLNEALASRLFRSTGSNVFTPVHRTVAEFLAARYLADRLHEKLSFRRVLALICGSDGGIVSSMRGLAGWLASLAAETRLTFIRLDSLCVLLYGDAKNFSISDKTALIEQLGSHVQDSPSFRWHEWNGLPFAALVTSEMRPLVSQRMAEPNYSDAHQLLLVLLLEGMLHQSPDAGLTTLLLALVRDESRWLSVRMRALKIHISWAGVNDPSLRSLLADIESAVVEDGDDEILGALLEAMYPATLAATELPKFFHLPKQRNLIGNYQMFWEHDVGEIDCHEAMKLLDAFAAETELKGTETSRSRGEFVGRLVSRVLKESADIPHDDQLLNWLDTACGEYGESLLDHDDREVLHQWLRARPHRYFSLLDLALNRFSKATNPVQSAEVRLHRAAAPTDAAAWWLARAQKTHSEADAKRYFFQAIYGIPDEYAPGLEEVLITCEDLSMERGWQDLLAERFTYTWERWGWMQEEVRRKQDRAQKAAERRNTYRARIAEFSKPLVPLGLLDQVAAVYLHKYYDIDGETPQEKLSSFFAGDEELVQAALLALRRTLHRADLPSSAETINALNNEKSFTLNTPVLVSLDIAYEHDRKFFQTMTADRLVAALVVHLVHRVSGHDTWVSAVVASLPHCMAEAFRIYFTNAMQWKSRSPAHTHLFRDESYSEVTKLCLLPLLAQFPLRSNPHLRSTLTDMLRGAFTLSVRDELLSLVQIRLDNSNKVDGQQRACWLAVGLLLYPERYMPVARCYLTRRLRVEHLSHFLDDCGQAVNFLHKPAQLLGLLIEHLAVGCSPSRLTEAGLVTRDTRRPDLVKSYLNELAGRHDAESEGEFKRLSQLTAIVEWASELRAARLAQQIVRRDATYEKPNWRQVSTALQRGKASSPAEIAAVVNDLIEGMKEQVRYSDLNLNLQYWNAGAQKKPSSPRHEELCRDTFSTQLRERLRRFEIECLPETHHVDGKRSDVWCTVGTQGGVPIEIKRDQNRGLWTAVQGQLISRYTTDPRAKGYGIYIVLWFGNPNQIPAPPTGVKRPQTADELQSMLEMGLSEEDKRSVTIHVLDCSVRT